MNHLEELVSEWLAFRGYFVRRNVPVDKRATGGYECELDVIAFHPKLRRLIHVEPSLDAHSWDKREARFARKFAAGQKHIPKMFEGLSVPDRIEQIALFAFASAKNRKTIGGGRVVHINDLYIEILVGLKDRSVASEAVFEQFPLIRTLQQARQAVMTLVPANCNCAVGWNRTHARLVDDIES